MINFSLLDSAGGSAEVFRTVGEKWKGLPEESKKEYRNKALEAGSNLPSSSNRERSLKIMKNMMKEVYLRSLVQKMYTNLTNSVMHVIHVCSTHTQCFTS